MGAVESDEHLQEEVHAVGLGQFKHITVVAVLIPFLERPILERPFLMRPFLERPILEPTNPRTTNPRKDQS